MKFSASLNIHGLQHFVECLLCLNKLCKELPNASLPYLKLTHNRVSLIIKTNGLIDSYLEIDSTELFQCPFVLESQTNNVIVLEVDISSLYDALNSATRSEHITIKLIKHKGGFLSVKFTDPIYPTIVITLDVPVNPINEDINRNSVIPIIPPCSWNIGLSKLQSITYFLESVYKIGNDLVEFQVIRNRYTQNDAVSVDGSVFYSSTLKLRSFGNIADLETVFHGLHIFSSLPDQELVHNENSTKAFLKIHTLNLLCQSVIDSNLHNKNKALMIAAIPDNIETSQWIYIIVSIIKVRGCMEWNIYGTARKLSNGICYSKLYPGRMKSICVVLFATAYAYITSIPHIFGLIKSKKHVVKVNATDDNNAHYDNKGPFKLMELPYDLWSLSPEISEETLSFHYLKHHAGYVNKLNELSKDDPSISKKSIEELVKTSDGLVYNMAAQVWNHDFYWNGLTPNGGELTTFVDSLITKSFGSYSDFVKKLTNMVTRHFGSGWIWLLYEEFNDPPLRLIATQDAGNPIRLFKVNPVLVIDVWEHAYYIDYRNDRKAYVNGWLKKVNWKRVDMLIKGSTDTLTTL